MSPTTLSRRAAVFMLVLLAAALTLSACGGSLESQIADTKWIATDPTCLTRTQGQVDMPPNFLLESKTKAVQIDRPKVAGSTTLVGINMTIYHLDYRYEMKADAPERLTLIPTNATLASKTEDFKVKLANGVLWLTPQKNGGTPTCGYAKSK